MTAPNSTTPDTRDAWTDAQRMDLLQQIVDDEGALLLHNGQGVGSGFVGFGLANLGRTLRQALDANLDVVPPKNRLNAAIGDKP